MQVSKIVSFTSANAVNNKYSTTPLSQKPVAGWFPDVFNKTNIDDVKDLKTKEGNARFNKNELKEIKSYVKKEKLDTTTVKHLSDTMLDVKSMSEAYLFAKNTTDPMKEISFIKTNLKQFEKPYEKWSDTQKEGIHTKLMRTEGSNKAPLYKIQDETETRGAIYSENGKFISSYEITAGPLYPDSEGSSGTSTSTSNKNDWNESPLNPLNPCSPLYN